MWTWISFGGVDSDAIGVGAILECCCRSVPPRPTWWGPACLGHTGPRPRGSTWGPWSPSKPVTHAILTELKAGKACIIQFVPKVCTALVARETLLVPHSMHLGCMDRLIPLV